MEVLEVIYFYMVLVFRENIYGMLLYSKVKLEDVQVYYLIEFDVFFIECRMILGLGYKVYFFGVYFWLLAFFESMIFMEKDRELLIVVEWVKFFW